MSIETIDRPIFVLGPPRSGTSMMQWSLRAHARLWGGPESDFLVPMVEALRDVYTYGSRREKFHWLSGQKVSWPEFLGHIGSGVNAMYTNRSGGLRWVEQTPYYTLALADMADLFPGAQFLVMVRDGRQVVHSLRNFVNPMNHEKATETWVRYMTAALDFERSNRGEMMFRVAYADVVEETETTLRNVYDFVGEPFDRASVDFIRSSAPINSSFTGETSTQKVESKWSTWTREERVLFVQIAGPLLLELGFESDHTWIEDEFSPV